MDYGEQLRKRKPDWADNNPHVIGFAVLGVIAVVVVLINYFGGSWYFPIP